MADTPIYPIQVTTENNTGKPDLLAVEEPLEIRIGYGEVGEREQLRLAVTMRTPGHDFELVAGFLFNEGLITGKDELEVIKYCTDAGRSAETGNVIRAEYKPGRIPEIELLQRNFYTNSSCGVCGKTSIESIFTKSVFRIQDGNPTVKATVVQQLQGAVEKEQPIFSHTGSLHAAALFTPEGKLELLREDVGRHNALDKLTGACVYKELLPLHTYLLWVSGRLSFELVQKAAMAGIPVMAAVGAPSSLAVQTAQELGITLLGFLRSNRFNIYTHPERIDFS